MIVTDIKPQQKAKDRVSVFIDKKYCFSLNKSQLQEFDLKINQDLSETEIENYKKQSSIGKLIDKTLRWLSVRVRSIKETQDYIAKQTDDLDEREMIFNKIDGWGYMNDLEFARVWVRNRRILKDVSRKHLFLELRQKGISSDIIDEVLSEDMVSDNETLKNLIIKKQSQTRYQDQTKLIAYLQRQGFRYSEIKECLSPQD